MARKSNRRPIWTIDAETDPFRKGRVPLPFIWGVYQEDGVYNEFEKTEDMIAYVSQHKVIAYAHNGGKFDWHFVTDYIEDFEPLTIINGRLAKFTIGECELRDSFNIIPAPLSAYQKDEIDYDIFEESERYKPKNWTKIRSYLKSDCIYLHEMIMEFVEEYGISLTQAGAAMKFWSKLTGTKKPQSSDMYYERMSKYYYGGRVECFHKGIIEEQFKVVDINSAYPYAMTFEHPWGLAYNTYDEMPNISDEELSRCFITLQAKSLGAFPYRTDKGLIFPNDNIHREFHITGWEYIAARDTGALEMAKIISVKEYMETISFKEYVDHFFALKDEATKELAKAKARNDQKGISLWSARRLFAKLFLNSLYGKFASNPENYEEFMTLPASMIDAALNEDGWFYCKLLSEETAIVNRPLEEEKRRYYDVAVAASITGFVRSYLWRNIASTKGTILYCDTDSIAASYIDDIPISDRLGDWDLEAECDFAAIAGKKLYAFRKTNGEYKTASKGVRLSAEDIIDIAKGAEIVYEPDVPTFSVKRGIIFTPRTVRMT